MPGTNTVVPIMTLGDQLSKMSLAVSEHGDPMSDALRRGKIPTLGEVKRSLKVHRNRVVMQNAYFRC